LEILSWLFVVLVPHYFCLRYLITQRLFFIIGLTSVFYRFKIGVIVAFLLKLGLPPLHIWFVRLSFYLNQIRFIFINTFHKLFPLLLITKFVINFVILIIVSFLVLGGLLIRNMLFPILVFSSIIHNIWLLISGVVVRKGFFINYWLLYTIVLFGLITRLGIVKTKWITINQGLNRGLNWILLSGLPPFTFFWLKASVILNLLICGGIILLFLLIIGFAAISAYYRAWHFGRRILSEGFIKEFRVILVLLVFWGGL